MKPSLLFWALFFSYFSLFDAQQTFLNNKQLDCSANTPSTLGFLCNGVQSSCDSYLTFRSQPPYDSAVTIGYLLNSTASKIAQINGVTDVEKIPKDTLILVPLNCSCSGNFYQHNASYSLKNEVETYFIVANDTYQGLTTCQALMNQNTRDSRNLTVGLELLVPLRCACPSRKQTSIGVKFLLNYLITWGNTISAIADMFNVDEQSVLDANELTKNLIFPFNPLLIPLKNEPTRNQTIIPPPPAESPQVVVVPTDEKGSKGKWVFIGFGIGVGFILLALCGFLLLFLSRRRQQHKTIGEDKKFESVKRGELPEKRLGSFASEGAREVMDSLMVYKFEELQRATRFFNEDSRIQGCVYLGVINGDNAAIKQMKGDVSNEINILKQINHSNMIRLSGFCLHEGNSYLVYEFAENGSLTNWLHQKKYQDSSSLSWKQRVQIAYDVADGLNYLHNYAIPPYIHKNLKSSNILLDGNFRAKVANFGLARTMDNQEGGGLQLTRHVVGTQGYMAPEYLEHGLITPKLDVFAFGVVMLELLSGREAVIPSGEEEKGGDLLLSASIMPVLDGENVRLKLKGFVDPCLQPDYPFDSVFTMAQLAMNCLAQDPSSRPTMAEIFMSLSKILSSSLDSDSSDNASSGSAVHVR
ncbi:protein kinase superfamily protein [Tasmannia lanceolata]|uniref:protein kinase superfamily protein n=1 Tax=Tasmannia lanceolata TaxID=3420 RepID=UPI004062B67E